MTLMTVFVLVGSVQSTDDFFATVQLQTKEACEQEAALAVLPLHAFPCVIKAGDSFHVLKETEDSTPIIQCGEFEGKLNPTKEDSK
tara:strand:- start:407 stop:664 length:258 start_codon:yes stop_codon:yes gene_type:complete